MFKSSRLDRLEPSLEGRQPLRERLALLDQRRRIAALRLGLPGGLGIRIALRAQRIGLDLRNLALSFQCGDFLDVENKAAARELGGHLRQIIA